MEKYIIERLKDILTNVNYLNGDYTVKFGNDNNIIVKDDNGKNCFSLAANELTLFVPLHTEIYNRLREFVFDNTQTVVRFYTDDDGQYSTILMYDVLNKNWLFTNSLVSSSRFITYFDEQMFKNRVEPFLTYFSSCSYTVEKILN